MVVVDSTCLIALDKIGHLGLLGADLAPVVAPAVRAEFGEPLPDWIAVREPRDPVVVAALGTQLGAGEAESIALALEPPRSEIILDDKKARRVAGQLGLRVFGTLGLVLRAKAAGRIALVTPVLEALRATGFHMTEALFRTALRLADE